jgi:hypothetical protein
LLDCNEVLEKRSSRGDLDLLATVVVGRIARVKGLVSDYTSPQLSACQFRLETKSSARWRGFTISTLKLEQTGQAYINAPTLLNSGLFAMQTVSYRTIPNASTEIALSRPAVFGNLKEKKEKRRKQWPKKECCVTQSSSVTRLAYLPADQIEKHWPRNS